MPYLLDTSALSEPLRRSPNTRFMDRLARASPSDLFTSAVCVMELRLGAALRPDALWTRIADEILSKVRILAFGEEEAMRCGELLADLSRAGTPIGVEDSQIGATALVHGLAVVTFNRKHFDRIPRLPVEDWR